MVKRRGSRIVKNISWRKSSQFAAAIIIFSGCAVGFYRYRRHRSELLKQDGVTVRWEKLEQLDFKTGQGPEEVKSLNGKRVHLAGFIVPLDDDAEEAKEFLLVAGSGSCIHTPPPPSNQMVYVKMDGDRGLKLLGRPLWVTGILHIDQVKSPYGVVAYRLDGLDGVPFKSWQQFE